MIKTILITNQADIARDAEAAGVSRIMVDLETLGKKERQATRNTFITTHVKEDVAKIRGVLKNAELIVRINPMHFGSGDEIDEAIGNGADIIMLPMVTRMVQFEDFVRYVDGRVKTLPLLETSYSMAHISDIGLNNGVDELYFGLNDLHLSLGLDFLFEPLALGLIDWMSGMAAACGKPFGFGGMAAIGGQGELPPERILGEHTRLGSSSVILSSRFCKDVDITNAEGRPERLKVALSDIGTHWQRLKARTSAQQQADATETFAMIRALSDRLRHTGSL